MTQTGRAFKCESTDKYWFTCVSPLLAWFQPTSQQANCANLCLRLPLLLLLLSLSLPCYVYKCGSYYVCSQLLFCVVGTLYAWRMIKVFTLKVLSQIQKRFSLEISCTIATHTHTHVHPTNLRSILQHTLKFNTNERDEGNKLNCRCLCVLLCPAIAELLLVITIRLSHISSPIMLVALLLCLVLSLCMRSPYE